MLKLDVYSFGVVLLELIMGWKVIDNLRVVGEYNLVVWVRNVLFGFGFVVVIG